METVGIAAPVAVRAYMDDPRWLIFYYLHPQPGRIAIIGIVPR